MIEQTQKEAKKERRHHLFLTPRGLEYRAGDQWCVEPFDAGQAINETVDYLFHANRCVWITDREIAAQFAKAIGRKSKIDGRELTWSGEGDFRSLTVASEARRVDFRFPALFEGWRLNKTSLESAESAIGRYQEFFNINLWARPNKTGLEAIRAALKHTHGGERIEGPESFDVFDSRSYGQAINWTRALTEEECAKRFIHAYDKKASYLNSCDAVFGIGEYREVKSPVWNKETVGMPGLWRLKFVAQPMNPLMPPVNLEQEWFYTPTVRMLASLGAEFEVIEAKIFPQKSRLLEAWRRRVIELMKSFDLSNESDVAFRGMIKATYTTCLGLIASKQWMKGKDWMYRPDWYDTIKSEAAARMIFNAEKVASLTGAYPVAIHDDCLYYASDEADPVKAFPFLTDAKLSGMYAFKGSYLTNDVRHLCGAASSKFTREIKNYEIGGGN